eukprot:COSAG05_NODE_511_length_9092_cov_6.078839_4_plen_113_part_00
MLLFDGWRLAGWLAGLGAVKVAKHLVELGGAQLAPLLSSWKASPLLAAAERGHGKIVRYLLRTAADMAQEGGALLLSPPCPFHSLLRAVLALMCWSYLHTKLRWKLGARHGA